MTNCLIIGAGLVGLSTAYELQNSGFNITVVDNEKDGQASKAAAGLLFPLSPWKNSKYMQDLCISGHQEYSILYKNLNNKDRKKINLQKKDLLIFGEDVKSAVSWYRNKDFIQSEFYEENLNSVEKNIKNNYKNFLIIKNIHTVDPINLINYYKKYLEKSNVKFKKETIQDVYSYIELKENLIYDFIIIAAGSWSNQIIKEHKIALKPIKGQLLHLKTEKKLLDKVLLHDSNYIVPKENNTIIVGATIEDVGFNNKLSTDAENYLRDILANTFLNNFKILDEKFFYGFRPRLATDIPYIKTDPNNSRIVYNFGHYRYGILTAISSAKIVKNLIT